MYEGKKIPVTEWTPVQGELISAFFVLGSRSCLPYDGQL